MTRITHPDSREEEMRAWAGRLLIGGQDCAPPPIDDAKRIRGFLRRHGVTALLTGAPGDRLTDRRPHHDDGVVKSAVAAEMVRRHELAAVLRALRSRGLPAPIIFKGQALACTLYPQPWLRPRTDIDALIERGDFDAMIEALSALGYERADAIDADLILPQASLRRHRHGVSHVWDVHWRISNRPGLADILTIPEIRRSAVETRVNDTWFLMPERVDSLLLACLHLVGHHAGDIRLIWLYDIHLLAASLSTTCHHRFLDKAMDQPPTRAACHAAFELTQRYLPAEHTDALRRALDPGAGARWPVERTYLAGLVEDAGAVGAGNRLRFVAQHVFPSADYMTKRFGIRHRWQLPFWYVVRIGRAVPKLFRRR